MGRVAVCVSVALMICGQIALACGDRLVPIGGGVHMERIVRSAFPGTVYVLSSTGSNRATETELVAGLVRTGHRARLVTTADELQTAVVEHAPDVVLADASDLAAVQSRFGAGPTPVVVLVLVRPNRHELDAAHRTTACVAEVPDWGVSPVVRVVNNIRASQESGRSIECFERSRPRS